MEQNQLVEMLKSNMREIQNKYKDVDNKMQELVNQSKVLQENYNNYALNKEQLRGEYTALYNLLTKLVAPKSEETTAKEDSKSTVKSDKKNSKAKVEKSDNNNLTAEEIETIKALNDKKEKTIKQADIPDYLLDEYKK